MASDPTFGSVDNAQEPGDNGSAASGIPVPADGIADPGSISSSPGADWRIDVVSRVPRPLLGYSARETDSLATHLSQWTPATVVDLARRLQQEPPKVLLVDVELCETFGAAGMRHLRQVMPASIEWMLVWDSPSVRWVGTIVVLQARGAVSWDVSPSHLGQALATVCRGEMWFPRAVMESLCNSQPFASNESDRAAEIAGAPVVALTAREDEVLALMRDGLTNKAIATRLGISVNTVKKHLSSVFYKRGLHRRRQAIG